LFEQLPWTAGKPCAAAAAAVVMDWVWYSALCLCLLVCNDGLLQKATPNTPLEAPWNVVGCAL
jgi:hypothetical protein